MPKIVLAIVGLSGSGKTETTKYLEKKTGWPKVYFGEPTFDVLRARGLAFTEENERPVREELRRKHGMAASAILSLPKIREHFVQSSVLLESLYSWEEYLTIKKEFGTAFRVLAVYASPEIRQKRMVARRVRPLTAAEFESRDYSQIENLHQAGPIARADHLLVNEGTLAALHKQIDKFFKRLHVS